MKTLKRFLDTNSSNPELHRLVFKAGGVAFSEFKERPYDFYAANTGAVSGMIYYEDTVRFAKKNLVLIMDALNRFENECGLIPDKPTDDKTQFYNWLAWFAWESMAGELLSYLEN
ncbi:MAG: hypothetical protein EOO90_03405 [Pedobacter sp.]|nr:MAG: hypothetical protein EOO90_03405 [Pedobacter sp.]